MKSASSGNFVLCAFSVLWCFPLSNAGLIALRSWPHDQKYRQSCVKRTSTNMILPSDAITALESDKVCIVQDFLSANLCDALRSDIRCLRQANAFRRAGVGRSTTNRQDADVRITESCWLFPPPPPSLGKREARRELYNIVESLTKQLSSSARPLSLGGHELAYLHYPAGGYYKRHFDVPAVLQPDDRGRVVSEERRVSFLIYLNKGWQEDWGGKLRVYKPLNDEEVVRRRSDGKSGGMEISGEVPEVWDDITPEGGTLVCFYSDAVEHEVIATSVERQVVVGWLKGSISHEII